MIEDARTYSEAGSLDVDICVIGAGAAGVTIAQHFIGSRHRLLLIESGGLRFEYRPQRLSRGVISGEAYEPLNLSRVRQLGGSTGKAGWGGWCKPLSTGDFEARPWVPLSGWPLDPATLTPYYDKARRSLALDDAIDWRSEALEHKAENLLLEPCALSPAPDLGRNALPSLRTSPNIQVLHHATVTRLIRAPGSARIDSVEVVTEHRQRRQVRAQIFVLAAGGLENPRLLLLSDIGNGHDLVGRYFMEHPRIRWGRLTINAPLGRLQPLVPNGQTPQSALAMANFAGLTIGSALEERFGLLKSRSWIKRMPPVGHGEAARALNDLSFWLRKGRRPPHIRRDTRVLLRHAPEAAVTIFDRLRRGQQGPVSYSFDTIMEQEPDYDSRVRLDEQRDVHGLPMIRLEWHLSQLVHDSFAKTRQLITQDLQRLGYACEDDVPSGPIRWVRHHMGTTRMARNARDGVVDSDCRLFDTPNMFVAGSSVFPCGGNDMPTMTIVALAHRIAERVEQELDRH